MVLPAGSTDLQNKQHAAPWRESGRPIDLVAQGSLRQQSYARGIYDAGHVVGYSSIPAPGDATGGGNGGTHALLWTEAAACRQ